MGLRFKARFRVGGLGCLGSRSRVYATLVTFAFAPDKIVVVVALHYGW